MNTSPNVLNQIDQLFKSYEDASLTPESRESLLSNANEGREKLSG